MEPQARTIRALCALLAFVLALALPARAQDTLRANAALNSGVVKLGSEVRLTVDVEGTTDASFAPLPEIKGLRLALISGPNPTQSYDLSFGRQVVSRRVNWVFSVQALEKGEFTIPPLTLRAGGKEIQTHELTLKVVEDIQGEEFGLFELDAPREVVEGQPFSIEMRFGWDSSLSQQVNYANLSLPWLGELSGLLELEAPSATAGIATIQLNLNKRDVIVAEQMGEKRVGDRSFVVLRVRKRFVATRSGKLVFPTSHIEFGTREEGGFFARPRPRVPYFKRFPAFEIDVSKLPEQGRPLDFSGLVGHVTASATADRRLVDAGDSIKLAVEWAGEGNLEFFQPPDLAHLDAFKDFRVYGSTDRKTFERRTVTYDIAPTKPEIKEIPPVPLSIYDADKHAYGTLQTQPIPIQVRALKNASPLGPEGPGTNVVVDIRDIQTAPLAAVEPPRPRSRTILFIGALIVAGWIALRTLVRRSGDPDAPRARARRAARKQLVRALAVAQSASAQSHALAGFLAARTGETPEAWSGRDVLDWARTAREAEAAPGLQDEKAQALARTFAELDKRTWAGRDEPLDTPSLLALADELVKGGL